MTHPKRLPHALLATQLALLLAASAQALDYPHQTAEPQKTGWPLTPEERAYVVERPSTSAGPVANRTSICPSSGLWCRAPATSVATRG